ncbi:hypothetical protein Q428_05995 [Fervidicella metallireducens AeB]|uniref:Flagellar protein FlaG n=1 Tax=Fervidicella metallireducens AeB TaxID=1403537 RepID=A0A017RY02_9CLOT|nr:hypothetical protein [Fervidicella metallireducens]EYE88825.1 hypothetical protein Q428_05995 [Fervidicella metallireducens AeB]
MSINPFTLDKIEPLIIKQVEQRIVDRIVHEVKGAELSKDKNSSNKNFNEQRQQKAAEEFTALLSRFNIKVEYRLHKNKVKLKMYDKDNNEIYDSEVDDVEDLLLKVRRTTGNFIDLKG